MPNLTLKKAEIKAGESEKELQSHLKKMEETRTALYNILEDVKESEKKIKEERDRSEAIVSSMGEGLLLIDRDYKIILINKKAEEFLGISPGQADGQNIKEIFKVTKGDKLLSDEERPVARMFKTGQTVIIDLKDNLYYRTASGKKFAISLTAAPLKGDGITGAVMIFRDITEMRNLLEKIEKAKENMEEQVKERSKELSQERGTLLSLVESVKLGIVMVDLSFNIVFANPTAKDIFSNLSGEPLTFKDLEKKLKSINLSRTLSYYVQNSKVLNIQEVKIGERYYRLFMSAVRDIVDKIFIGSVMIIEDITEQKLIDTMRTEIVSVTSHQLRTPLSVIKGNLEMVLGGDVGKITKEQAEILKEALSGNERMIKLVNDLMDVSKITEGRLDLELKPDDLENLISETIKEISLFAKNNNTEVIYEKPLKPLPKIKLDRQRMKQVIQNLIDDAIKYSHRDHRGKVKVKLKKTSDNLVELTIADNGIGIPKEEQGKIFERFFRASNISKLDPGGGTGLGLFIAKSIIGQHRGKIRFESEEGKGTTFFISLPI